MGAKKFIGVFQFVIKKLQITPIKKLVGIINGTRFENFRIFSQKKFDILTSKIEFLSKVPILKVVQNTILYIVHI